MSHGVYVKVCAFACYQVEFYTFDDVIAHVRASG